MAAPRNSAESDKTIEESQEMTYCSIPPPPIDFSPLSPYPWSPTDLPWSPSCLSQSATEPPLPFSQLSPLPILPSDQSIKIPQFQQHEDTVFNEIISSLCLQLQNTQLLPKILHKVSPQQLPDLLAQLLAQQLLPQLPPQQLSQQRQLEKLEVLLLLDLLFQLRQLLLQLPLVQMPLLLWLSLLLQQMPQQMELLMLQLVRSQQQPLHQLLQQPQLLQSMRLPQLLQQSLQQKLQQLSQMQQLAQLQQLQQLAQLQQLPRLQQLLRRQQQLLQIHQPHRLQQLLRPLSQLLWQLPQQQSQRQSQQQLQLMRLRLPLPHCQRQWLHLSLLLPPLFLQSKSNALNLSPTFLNMGMNMIEHITWGLFRTPALPPIIKTKLYKGVWQRQDGEWVAKIHHHRKWVNIGTFNTAEEAAVAHDRAAYMLRGRLAQINFPELVGVSHNFLDKNKAEPTAATIMEILSPPTQQEDNPGEDSVLWWSKAIRNDEIEAVDIEGEETREDEMNSDLEKGKRKVMIAGEERETKKSGVRITIPLEDIQQRKEMSIKDAAMDLKVSKSTLKRVCRDYGIPRWPPRENNKLTSNSLPSKSPETTDQEEILRLNYDILPPNQALPIIDTNSVTIKARPENGDTIKFRLSSPWRKVELEHQVERRLELKAGTYSVKYKDQENDVILIGCDDDMEDCISYSRSIGVSSIEVFLEPKKPI